MTPPSSHKYGSSVRVWNVMDYFHPGAELLARALAKTSISPEAVVVAGTLIGIAGGACLALGMRGKEYLLAGAALILLKNILDKTDGALARLKGETSRLGRFLDSLGDFAVSCATFAGIGAYLAAKHGDARFYPAMAGLGLVSSFLQCTYFVYYQVAFIGRVLGRPTVNRTNESFTDADRGEPPLTRFLQRAYLLIYGWQDSFIGWIDARCRKGGVISPPPNPPPSRGRESSLSPSLDGRGKGRVIEYSDDARWFDDRWNLRLASFLGLGTHIALAALAAAFDRLEWYLVWAVVGGNVAAALLVARQFCRGA